MTLAKFFYGFPVRDLEAVSHVIQPRIKETGIIEFIKLKDSLIITAHHGPSLLAKYSNAYPLPSIPNCCSPSSGTQ